MAFFLMLALPLVASTSAEDIVSFELQNGMKILVAPDHSIPNANMYLFWKVGSRNEYPGITGLSHFFEHMMFNGAKKYGTLQFDRVMEAHGGANNAYTSMDLTVYTDWFPSNEIEIIFDLEADRIAHLSFDEKVIESERGVVASERRTSLENSTWERLDVQVKSAAYFQHPYSWPIIGYESDIMNWRRQDLEAYFKTYYAPGNCIVVIAGDVQVEKVKKLAKQYFEPIPAQEPPRPVHLIEPPQRGEKRVTVHHDVGSERLMLTWHVPASGDPAWFSFSMLADLLAGGPSSRLQRALVDRQLALRVSAQIYETMDPGLFYIRAIATKGTSAEKLEQAIYKELDRIVADGIGTKELQKVKNKKLKEYYQDIQTINGRANNLGRHEIYFGGYETLFKVPEQYEKITDKQVREAISTYLVAPNRTVGIMRKEVKQ